MKSVDFGKTSAEFQAEAMALLEKNPSSEKVLKTISILLGRNTMGSYEKASALASIYSGNPENYSKELAKAFLCCAQEGLKRGKKEQAIELNRKAMRIFYKTGAKDFDSIFPEKSESMLQSVLFAYCVGDADVGASFDPIYKRDQEKGIKTFDLRQRKAAIKEELKIIQTIKTEPPVVRQFLAPQGLRI